MVAEAAALVESTLLGHLDKRTQRRLLDQGTRRIYAPGEVIVREGDAASAFYLVLRGRVEITRLIDGVSTKLGEQGAGSFFGEMALLEDHPRTATVTAIEKTECLLVVAWEFTALMHEHPAITESLLRELVARIHRAEHHVL